MRIVSLLASLLLFSCQGSELHQSNYERLGKFEDESKNILATDQPGTSVEKQVAVEPTVEPAVESATEPPVEPALEPVMVGGAFLRCQPEAQESDELVASCRVERDNQKIHIPSYYQVEFYAKDRIGTLEQLAYQEIESDAWQWQVRAPRNQGFVGFLVNLILDGMIIEEMEVEIFPEDFQTDIQLICGDVSSSMDFAQEFAEFCLPEAGEPSPAFLNAMEVRVGESSGTLLAARDRNGRSRMIGINSMRIAVPIEKVLERKARINTINYRVDGLDYNYSAQSEGMVENDKHLANYEVMLNISNSDGNQLFGLTMQRDFFSLRPDNSLINFRSSVTTSQTNTSANIHTSNALYYFIGDGEKTLIVGVFKREISHQTNHDNVVSTFESVNARIFREFSEVFHGN